MSDRRYTGHPYDPHAGYGPSRPRPPLPRSGKGSSSGYYYDADHGYRHSDYADSFRGYASTSSGSSRPAAEVRRSRSPPSRLPPRPTGVAGEERRPTAGPSRHDSRLSADPRRRLNAGEIEEREVLSKPKPGSTSLQSRRSPSPPPVAAAPHTRTLTAPSSANEQASTDTSPTAADLSGLFENVVSRMSGLATVAQQAPSLLPSSLAIAQGAFAKLKDRQQHLERVASLQELIEESEAWVQEHPEASDARVQWTQDRKPELLHSVSDARTAADKSGEDFAEKLAKLADVGPACSLAVATSARNTSEIAEAMQEEYRAAFQRLLSDVKRLESELKNSSGTSNAATAQKTSTSTPITQPPSVAASAAERSQKSEEGEMQRKMLKLLRDRLNLVEEQIEELRETSNSRDRELEDQLPFVVRDSIRSEMDIRQKKRKLEPDAAGPVARKGAARSSLPPSLPSSVQTPASEIVPAASLTRSGSLSTAPKQADGNSLSTSGRDETRPGEQDTEMREADAIQKARYDKLVDDFRFFKKNAQQSWTDGLAGLRSQVTKQAEQFTQSKFAILENNIKTAFNNTEAEFKTIRKERDESFTFITKEIDRLEKSLHTVATTARDERQFLYEQLKRLHTADEEQRKSMSELARAVTLLVPTLLAADGATAQTTSEHHSSRDQTDISKSLLPAVNGLTAEQRNNLLELAYNTARPSNGQIRANTLNGAIQQQTSTSPTTTSGASAPSTS